MDYTELVQELKELRLHLKSTPIDKWDKRKHDRVLKLNAELKEMERSMPVSTKHIRY